MPAVPPEPRKSLQEANSGLPGHLTPSHTTTKEDTTMSTASIPISSPETELETAPAAPTRQSRRRPSSEPTGLGTRKTSFMLDERGRAALAGLMPMWGFPSKGVAVTQALVYLLHQSKKDVVRKLPVEE